MIFNQLPFEAKVAGAVGAIFFSMLVSQMYLTYWGDKIEMAAEVADGILY